MARHDRQAEFNRLLEGKHPGFANPQAALAALQGNAWPLPRLSPMAGNIIETRAYFGLPLGDAGFEGQAQIVLGNIRGFLEAAGASAHAVTDIFVVSHGWHRNLFTGASAYDRLLARFSLLKGRGVIQPAPGFMPLFIGLQWISDPGPAGWVDPQGRRDKTSFMDNVGRLFDPRQNEAQFTKDFEEMFALMSKVSAPDAGTIDAADRTEGARLQGQLLLYDLRLDPKNTLAEKESALPEKVAALWMCYHEATAKAALSDQDEEPRPTSTIFEAIWTTTKFVVGTVGGGAVLGWLKSVFLSSSQAVHSGSQVLRTTSESGRVAEVHTQWNYPTGRSLEFLTQPWTYLSTHNPLTPDANSAIWNWPILHSPDFWYWAAALTLLPLAIMGIAVFGYWLPIGRRQPKKGTTPIVIGLAWVPLQIILTLPVLIFLILTYLFRSSWIFLGIAVALCGFPGIGLALFAFFVLVACVQIYKGRPASAVFRERLLKENSDPKHWREYLAALARFPINWLKRIVPADSFLITIAKALDNQFAFFEMQRKGVDCGDDGGDLLYQLFSTPIPGVDLTEVRVHFVGHSFGGLIVLNAIRGFLQRCPDPQPAPGQQAAPSMVDQLFRRSKVSAATADMGALPVRMRSLCLVQSATSSDWFDKEVDAARCFSGALACIYSRYDTANGFYYPMANNGRMAAGYVGLCRVGSRDAAGTPIRSGNFTMLVKPLLLDQPPTSITAPAKLNLDSSTLIYQGAIPAGGGHDDIFKDDVVNLIWSAVRL